MINKPINKFHARKFIICIYKSKNRNPHYYRYKQITNNNIKYQRLLLVMHGFERRFGINDPN